MRVLKRATGADNFGSGPLDASGVMRWEAVTKQCLDRGLRIGAEVGVADGLFSAYILEHVPGSCMRGIDPWERRPRTGRVGDGDYRRWDTEWQMREAMKVMMRFPGRCKMIRGYSVAEAAKVADGSLDFVFIDARHQEEHVREDIAAWTPKVRGGGLVCGHDINMKGVRAAVNATGPFWTGPDQTWFRLND